jgi:hypothetical protein
MRLLKFLPVLALCSGLANADTVATLQNKAGGVIVLTDVSTERCRGFAGAVYATADNSQTYWGCWFSDDMMVHIRWADGDTRAYPLEKFTVNTETARKLRERRQGGSSL